MIAWYQDNSGHIFNQISTPISMNIDYCII